MAQETSRTFKTVAEYRAAYDAAGHDIHEESGFTQGEIAKLIAKDSLDIVRQAIAGQRPTSAPATPLRHARIAGGMSSRHRQFR